MADATLLDLLQVGMKRGPDGVKELSDDL
jgi:hypothetical protein